jgi:hypothetical protein
VEDGREEVSADPDPLSPSQERALLSLLNCSSHKEAAAAAGVSETTLWRYKRDEAFSSRLRLARRESVDRAVMRIQRDSVDAAAVLRDLMMKEDVPPFARIAAARAVLDQAVRLTRMDELRERVEQLEEYLRAKQEQDELHDAARREREDGR